MLSQPMCQWRSNFGPSPNSWPDNRFPPDGGTSAVGCHGKFYRIIGRSAIRNPAVTVYSQSTAPNDVGFYPINLVRTGKTNPKKYPKKAAIAPTAWVPKGASSKAGAAHHPARNSRRLTLPVGRLPLDPQPVTARESLGPGIGIMRPVMPNIREDQVARICGPSVNRKPSATGVVPVRSSSATPSSDLVTPRCLSPYHGGASSCPKYRSSAARWRLTLAESVP